MASEAMAIQASETLVPSVNANTSPADSGDLPAESGDLFDRHDVEAMRELALQRPDETTVNLVRADGYFGAHSWAAGVPACARIAAVRCELIYTFFSHRRFVTESGVRVALMRALATFAAFFTPKMRFAIGVAEEAFRGDLDLEAMDAVIDSDFPDPAMTEDSAERQERKERKRRDEPAYQLIWRANAQLHEGFREARELEVGDFVLHAAAALPAEHHHLLADLPAWFDSEIARLKPEDNRAVCPDCWAPCEGSCVCPVGAQAYRRVSAAMEDHGADLAPLRAIRTSLCESSLDARNGVPAGSVITPAVSALLRELAAVANGNVDPGWVEGLGGLEFEFAAHARAAEAAMPRPAFARALLVVAMVAISFETNCVARALAESMILRVLDFLRGRIPLKDLEEEREALSSWADCVYASLEISFHVVGCLGSREAMTYDASWLATHAAQIEALPDDDGVTITAERGQWIITTMIDAIDACAAAAATSSESALRTFLLEPGVELASVSEVA